MNQNQRKGQPAVVLRLVPSSQPSVLRLAYSDFALSRRVMRCTARTIEHYDATAGAFVAWLEEQGVTDPERIRGAQVRAYQLHYATGVQLRMGHPAADTSLHKQARGIKTLLRFFLAEKYMSEPIAVQMPRLAQKRLPYLTAPQIADLVKVCDSPRNVALLLVLVDSGVRCAEATALCWGDVDLVSGSVQVRAGKGRKDRTVAVGYKTRRALLAYRRWWCKQFDVPPEPADPLWVDPRNGYQLRQTAIATVFRRLRERTGIQVSPHILRRTFAVLCLRGGMSSIHLQSLMGHESPAMTAHYCKLLDADLLEAHMLHGPVDRL